MCHKWDEYSIQLNTQYASAAGRYSDRLMMMMMNGMMTVAANAQESLNEPPRRMQQPA